MHLGMHETNFFTGGTYAKLSTNDTQATLNNKQNDNYGALLSIVAFFHPATLNRFGSASYKCHFKELKTDLSNALKNEDIPK